MPAVVAVSRSVTTDANGNFIFADVLGGTYTLTETQPAAYADGLDAVGTAGGTLGNDVVTALFAAGRHGRDRLSVRRAARSPSMVTCGWIRIATARSTAARRESLQSRSRCETRRTPSSRRRPPPQTARSAS